MKVEERDEDDKEGWFIGLTERVYRMDFSLVNSTLMNVMEDTGSSGIKLEHVT